MKVKNRRWFQNYVWEFYKPNGIYGDFFGHTLTYGELEEAVTRRMKSSHFEGDSVDREKVRDIMIEARKRMIERMIKVVCAWCKSTIKDGPEDKPVSHGICETCEKKHFPEERS